MNDVCRDTHTRTTTLTERTPIITVLTLVAILGGSACSSEAASQEEPRAGGDGSSLDEDPVLGGSSGGGAPAPEAEPDWCAARHVLEAKCQRCHGAAPEHGAPFSLTSYDDTQVLSARGKARFVAILGAVSADFMPPTFIELEPPVEPLTEQERAVLLRWCSLGAPPALAGDCEP